MVLLSTSIQPWKPTLSKLSHACKTQSDVDQIHAQLVTTGLVKDGSFIKKLIIRLSTSPYVPVVDFARSLLFSGHYEEGRDDPFLWNAVIKSYSHGNCPSKAFLVFCLMLKNGIFLDEYSFSLVLKSCSRTGLVKQGMQVHGLLRKLDFGSNIFLENCLICMYVKCGYVEFGQQVFDRMSNRDSISYNTMIDGYVKCRMLDLAHELFNCMPVQVRNLVSWNTLISGYVKMENFEVAWELFERAPFKDLVSWNLMIDCCVKSGKMEMAAALFSKMPKRDAVSYAILIDGFAKMSNINAAQSLFIHMPEKDVISCNAMMAGYVKNGHSMEALSVFHDMLNDSNLTPDGATLLSALSAVAQLGYIDEGLAIHCYIKDHGFVVHGKLGVALIDMYAKCGSIDNALGVFEDIKEKTVDHWNAMIGGLAVHGWGELAFDLFMEMERLAIEPDDITFIVVLNACGHAGLIKEGLMCFEIMRRAHQMEPKLQHYGCIVDILSRAGHMEEAIKFVEEMPIEPNDVVWRTLLSACSNHEHLDAAAQPVSKHQIQLNSPNSSSYVLLSNIYARFGMWDYVRRIRTMMKEKELKKVPGCSWIELGGTVHEFSAGDRSHPQAEDVSSTLQMVCT